MNMLSKILAAGILTVSCAFTVNSHAVTAWWAWGEVEFVQQAQGLITIKLTTAAADGCQSDRIYLYDSDLGETHVQRAFSMAIAAQASGRQMGIVIDLEDRDAGLKCKALGNMVLK